MSIKQTGEGGFIATGPHIDLVRLLALRGRLKLEVAGIRFKGRSSAAVARELLGSRTRSRKGLLRELDELLELIRSPK